VATKRAPETETRKAMANKMEYWVEVNHSDLWVVGQFDFHR
jgi:hypothetical protein